MMKIAIPLSDDILSKTFRQCSQYEFIEIDQNKIVNRTKETPPGNTLPGLYNWIAQKGVTDIIVHDIDKESIQFFAASKINLFIGIEIHTTNEIIEDYMRGTLVSNAQNIRM